MGALGACRQLYEEGRIIFYGENRWRNTAFRPIEKLRLSGSAPLSNLSASNSALIQNVTLKFGQRPVRFHSFVNSSYSRFPQLQNLRVWFDSPPVRSLTTLSRGSAHLRRALLRMVATMTQYHPVMRKAIWGMDSGAKRLEDSVSSEDLLSGRAPGLKFVYECRIDLVPVRYDEEIFRVVKEKLDDNGKPFMAKVSTTDLCNTFPLLTWMLTTSAIEHHTRLREDADDSMGRLSSAAALGLCISRDIDLIRTLSMSLVK